jgi:hypothetical protein
LESEAGFATFYLAFGGGRMTINLQKGWLKRPFLVKPRELFDTGWYKSMSGMMCFKPYRMI